MINKKNVLGKTPEVLGDKDAIHVAIVAVRAASSMEPGSRCGLNEDREAVANYKGIGIADPFRKKTILRGDVFWMMLAQDEVPNVQHHWEHPSVDFSPPTKEPSRNRWIKDNADVLGVTYEQLMEAAQKVVDTDRPQPYPGTKTAEELEEAMENEFERYDFWSEWAGEVLYEFENYGSACCPEYSYPDCAIFAIPESKKE